MRLVTLLVLLSGCSACGEVEQVQARQQAQHRPIEDLEVAAPANAEAAIGVVLKSYETRTGATADVRVRWFGEPFLIDGKPATGITYSCLDIWVWTEPGRRVADTALPHEMGHCLHAVVSGGDQDNAHADPAWWADKGHVQAAQIALTASGL